MLKNGCVIKKHAQLRTICCPPPLSNLKVNFLSYRYRADKSTNFGMRGLWCLTINSGRGAKLMQGLEIQDG